MYTETARHISLLGNGLTAMEIEVYPSDVCALFKSVNATSTIDISLSTIITFDLVDTWPSCSCHGKL